MLLHYKLKKYVLIILLRKGYIYKNPKLNRNKLENEFNEYIPYFKRI